MASNFHDFDIKQVPREDNTEVYGLGNLGSTFKIHPNINILISYVIKPAMEDTKEEVKPVKDLVFKNHEPKASWIPPIFQYLKDRSIPENENTQEPSQSMLLASI